MKVKIKCPDCTGIKNTIKETGLAILTGGFSLFMDEGCERCNGIGYIIVEVPEE